MRRNSLVLVALMMLMTAALLAAQTKSPEPAKKAAPARVASAGDIKKGKQVYEDYCSVCHFSTNREKKVGPGLRGIYKRGKFADGKKVDDATMRVWIEKGGKDMPAFEESITKEQIEGLIAYLKTI